MNSADPRSTEGHRERLRQKFQVNPGSLTESERLELLLTYVIPRRDVAPLAGDLLSRFGSLSAMFEATADELLQVNGIGESTATFFKLLQSLLSNDPNSQTEMSPLKASTPSPQLPLFEIEPKVEKTAGTTRRVDKKQTVEKERQMRVFANDEVADTLAFLPQATKFQSLEAFKAFLCEKLPYNAAETRSRRALNILERLYPDGEIETPLTYFAAQCSSRSDLQPVVFYHILKAEPIAAKVAEELIWPALPIGRVERQQMREFILHYLPGIGESSQNNTLRSLYYTYDLLAIGSTDKTTLQFQLHKGTLESFLYLLTSEFSVPGIYPFESLFNTPLQHWLLWDREWLRMQLYNLQDFGILTKVSEIDTVRQFTLALDQRTSLHTFFEHPLRDTLAAREPVDRSVDSSIKPLT